MVCRSLCLGALVVHTPAMNQWADEGVGPTCATPSSADIEQPTELRDQSAAVAPEVKDIMPGLPQQPFPAAAWTESPTFSCEASSIPSEEAVVCRRLRAILDALADLAARFREVAVVP